MKYLRSIFPTMNRWRTADTETGRDRSATSEANRHAARLRVTPAQRAEAAGLLSAIQAQERTAEEHVAAYQQAAAQAEERFLTGVPTTTEWTDPSSDPLGDVAAAAAQLRATALAARRTMDAHDEVTTAVEERLAELDDQIAGTHRRIAAAWSGPSMIFDQDHTHTWDRDDVQGRPGFACACGKSKCDLLRCVLEQDHEPPAHGFASDPPLLGG